MATINFENLFGVYPNLFTSSSQRSFTKPLTEWYAIPAYLDTNAETICRRLDVSINDH